jgi:hypothetical protein
MYYNCSILLYYNGAQLFFTQNTSNVSLPTVGQTQMKCKSTDKTHAKKDQSMQVLVRLSHPKHVLRGNLNLLKNILDASQGTKK